MCDNSNEADFKQEKKKKRKENELAQYVQEVLKRQVSLLNTGLLFFLFFWQNSGGASSVKPNVVFITLKMNRWISQRQIMKPAEVIYINMTDLKKEQILLKLTLHEWKERTNHLKC